MQTKVAKFGGSSLCNAEMFRKVYNIVKSDPSRRFIVPSAPGKRFSGDTKITDLLYKAYDINALGGNPDPILDEICDRFEEIIVGLGLNLSLKSEFDAIRRYFDIKIGRDFFASRGEYLSGIILANLLGYEFIDAADVIFFKENGDFDDEKTDIILSKKLENVKNAVIPGFFGSRFDGTIKTFSRGGSDITGAIVAKAVKADLYENWTDVSGFLMADPQIVPDPMPVPSLSYAELREMSYMGAQVLHEDAIYPVRQSGIPINIKNTNCPDDAGTLVSDNPCRSLNGLPVGITGKKGYTLISIEKNMMNRANSFIFKLLDSFERNSVPIQLFPIGVDNVSIIVKDKYFLQKENEILAEIKDLLAPDNIGIIHGISLLAVVGTGMKDHPESLCNIASALASEGISPLCFSRTSNELSLTVALCDDQLERAIHAIYSSFVSNQ